MKPVSGAMEKHCLIKNVEVSTYFDLWLNSESLFILYGGNDVLMGVLKRLWPAG